MQGELGFSHDARALLVEVEDDPSFTAFQLLEHLSDLVFEGPVTVPVIRALSGHVFLYQATKGSGGELVGIELDTGLGGGR